MALRCYKNAGFTQWRDTKLVCVASNAYSNLREVHVAKRLSNGFEILVEDPECIQMYNKTMGYVDKFDEMQSSYCFDISPNAII